MRKYNVQTIRDIYSSIIPKITTDPSFERPYGCWVKSNQNGFIEDLFRSRAATPITIADCRSCCDYAVDRNNDADATFFNDLATRQHKRYISLDGKHRQKCILDFKDNKISYTGIVIDDEDNERKVSNTFFKDLTLSEQNRFNNSQLCVTTFEKLARRELSEVFLALNANESLTSQQKRNAKQTPLASTTRDWAEKHSALFETIFSARNLAAMKQHEFVSKVFVHCDDSTQDVGDRALDAYYESGVDCEFAEVYSTLARKTTSEILDILTSLELSPSNLSIKKKLLCFTLVAEMVVKKQLEIVDSEVFMSEVAKLDNLLEQQSRIEHVENMEKNPDVITSNYYFEQQRLNWNHNTRYRRQAKIWKHISKDLSKFGLSEVDSDQDKAA